MSEWYEIKDQGDVELSKDGKTIQILFNTNNFGNQYVDVPISLIFGALNPVPIDPDHAGLKDED